MKEKFLDHRFNESSKLILDSIISIIEEYQSQGYRLTVRQVYYQLVSRGIILNKQNEYNKILRLLTNGRMAGFIDWEAIEDRLRNTYLPYFVASIEDAMEWFNKKFKRGICESKNLKTKRMQI